MLLAVSATAQDPTTKPAAAAAETAPGTAAIPAAPSVPAPTATPGPAPDTASPGAPAPATPATIGGLDINRQMIAAEDSTDIVINGSAGLPCGLRIEFGDGTAPATSRVGDASPFPLSIKHVFPKLGDYTVRVRGAADGGLPACEGQADVAVHVSPAGSKIEYITLSTSCPEGWKMAGAVNADASFSCSPIPDMNAPTNLIHCVDGMKYFAQGGRIGCRHPAAAPEETFAKAATPKGKATSGGRPKHPTMPLAKTPKDPSANAAPKKAPGTAPTKKAAPKAASKRTA